jgi:pyruvate/2-oxoglutarate dehydrogenase complex dihydrolipoamide dehydrogenase (E3) component
LNRTKEQTMNKEKVYDLVVIGGGSAGLSAVGFGLEMGATTALIERHRVGGDCTWSGCVPSKSLLKAAKVAHHMRTAATYGVRPVEPEVDMKAVMTHVHEIIAATYAEETPEVLREKGADVYLGEARFVDPHTLKLDDQLIKARNVVLATGAHPFVPPIEGVDDVDYLTYENIWYLEKLPEHLIVIGAGPIGSEMSQAFRRLGSRVTMVEGGPRMLGRDEPIASEIMMRIFRAEGIDLKLNHHAERIWRDDEGVHVLAEGEEIVGDALLMSVGRRPNVDALDLEKAGVEYSARGIEVNDKLQTTQPHIYAAGDCLGSYQFTHYAGWQASNAAARNALLPGSSKGIREWVPWTTFTEPEVAHAGLTEAEAREKYGDEVGTVEWPMERIDRARAEVDTEGVVFLVHKGQEVLGATIVAERAGEIIHEWILALEHGLKVRDLTTTIHVYPTYARATVKAGGRLLQQELLEGRWGDLIHKGGQWALKFMRWRRGF